MQIYVQFYLQLSAPQVNPTSLCMLRFICKAGTVARCRLLRVVQLCVAAVLFLAGFVYSLEFLYGWEHAILRERSCGCEHLYGYAKKNARLAVI